MNRFLKELIYKSPFEMLVRRTIVHFSPPATKDNHQIILIMKQALGKNSACVDIGASNGVLLKHMLRFAPAGQHYAFEPLPNWYNDLSQVVKRYPNVQALNLALSDTSGETTFQYVVSNPGYSGIKRRDYPNPDWELKELKVKVDRLDNIIPRDVKIDFIKIDVEGAELQVFKGAIETIKRCRPVIVFEHQNGAADQYNTTPEDVFDLLARDCGLRISLMDRWLKRQSDLSRQEFVDIFYKGTYFNFIAYPETD